MNAIIPEIYCTDIDRTRRFYSAVLGFRVLYERPEETFLFLEREGAELMVEQLSGPGRRWLTGPLDPPFGRGMSLQIRTSSVTPLLRAIESEGLSLFLPLEEKWYRRDDGLVGNRQFIVQDPDGYLLRFFEDLGRRPAG